MSVKCGEMKFSKLTDKFGTKFTVHALSKNRCNQMVERRIAVVTISEQRNFDRLTRGRALHMSNRPKIRVATLRMEKQVKELQSSKVVLSRHL